VSRVLGEPPEVRARTVHTDSATPVPPDPPVAPGSAWSRSRGSIASVLNALTIAVIAGSLAVLIGAVILLLDGRSPTSAFSAGWEGAAGDLLKFGVTANRAAPFLLAGLGFVIAYRPGLLNVGAEGQIFVGGAASGAVALSIGGGLTPYVAVPVALAAAAVAGGLISLLAGALYIWRRVSIVLSTLLLNFIAIQFVSYLVRTPSLLQESHTLGDGEGFEGTARRFPQSDQLPENFHLARLGDLNQAHLGVVLALVAAVIVALVLRHTALGFRLKAIGSGRPAAEHAGINITTNILVAMFLAGALGGLAGASLVMGDRHRVLETISEGFGFIAILAALLARSSPMGAVLAAFFFAILQRGGQVMEASGEAPEATVLIIQALVVIFIAVGLELERRWRQSRQKAKA
jgi:ABC-type uncharacterized transport system permease subunit